MGHKRKGGRRKANAQVVQQTNGKPPSHREDAPTPTGGSTGRMQTASKKIHDACVEDIPWEANSTHPFHNEEPAPDPHPPGT